MRQAGQATVEFGLVIGIVLLLLLGAAQTGLYAVERSNAVNAVEAGVFAAVSGAGSSSGPPATAQVTAVVKPLLDRALFGARSATANPVNGACAGLDPQGPVGLVNICSMYDPATATVEVSVRGWIPALVPPGFGLSQGRPNMLPLDVHEVAHVATFAP